MSDDVETKLSAARTRLILDKPFLGALVLRLPMESADPHWCKTTGTDARKFYYNAEYINELSLEQTQFVLAHEALHCALSHFARRQHRVKHRWDLACDFAINPILIQDGLRPPPDALYLESFAEMTAEEIYPLLDDMENQETMDQHLYDHEPDDADQGPNNRSAEHKRDQQEQQNGEEHGSGSRTELDQERGGAPQPPPLSADEQENLSVQWQQRMAGAAQQAIQAGKMGGALARMIDHLLQPQLPWRMLLARYLSASARTDYNYTRPSRREGSAILPSLRSSQVDVVVVLDTSGSISNAEISEFLSEVNAIKAQVQARITLHACDAALVHDGPWVFEPWEEVALPTALSGGGGTCFEPIFAWLDREARRPDVLVYFTDAEGVFPKLEPAFPVIWLVKGKAKVPWGQRVQLN